MKLRDIAPVGYELHEADERIPKGVYLRATVTTDDFDGLGLVEIPDECPPEDAWKYHGVYLFERLLCDPNGEIIPEGTKPESVAENVGMIGVRMFISAVRSVVLDLGKEMEPSSV